MKMMILNGLISSPGTSSFPEKNNCLKFFNGGGGPSKIIQNTIQTNNQTHINLEYYKFI